MNEKQKQFDIYGGKLLCLFLIINSLNLFIKQSNLVNLYATKYLSVFLGLIYLIVFIQCYSIFKPVIGNIIVFEIILVMLVACSVIANQDAGVAIIKRCIWTLAFCIPFFCIASQVFDRELFFEQTRIGCIVVLLVAVIECVDYVLRSSGMDYNMSIGYALAFPTIFHISKCSTRRWYYLLVVIEVIVVLIYGSRGPLLCIGVYLLLSTFVSKTNRGDVVVLRIFAICLMLFAVIDIDIIIGGIAWLQNFFGIKSRTITLLTNSSILSSSGRVDVWEFTIEKIMEKPILGWGIAGDQSVMISYPHQLFLELLLHFGVILGGVFCIVIVWEIVGSLLRTRCTDKVLVAFFSVGFVPLMLSDTYLDNVFFWILLALCSKNRIHFMIRA